MKGPDFKTGEHAIHLRSMQLQHAHGSGGRGMFDVKHDMHLIMQRIEMLDLKFDTLLDKMNSDERGRNRGSSRGRKLRSQPSS